MLLVSEDIPGIIMPAPPALADMPPIEEDEDTFDIDALHAAEDAEESAGNEGPLRLFIGAPAGGDPVPKAEAVDEPVADESPIWDVSALAMPEAPEADSEPEELDFLGEDYGVDEDDVVSLETSPPPLVMQVSLDPGVGIGAGEWADESPTIPAMLTSTLMPPSMAVSAPNDALDVPDRTPFELGEASQPDVPSRVEHLVNAALGDDGLHEQDWNEDEETFFGGREDVPRHVPETPPQLSVGSGGEGKSFRPIPTKTDPPVVPVLAALIGIVVIAGVLLMKFGASEAPTPGSLDNTVKARPPVSVRPAVTANPATANLVGDLGFLNIESDKDAIIYVGDRKVGTTPLKRVEVTPGNHRVLAMDVETGARKLATTVVVRGQERRIVFQFR
jgi:hypothetical protein